MEVDCTSDATCACRPRKVRVGRRPRSAASRSSDALNILHVHARKAAAHAVEQAAQDRRRQRASSKETASTSTSSCVKTISVDGGPTLKRWMPRADGPRHTASTQPHVHVTVVVDVTRT